MTKTRKKLIASDSYVSLLNIADICSQLQKVLDLPLTDDSGLYFVDGLSCRDGLHERCSKNEIMKF